MYLLVSIMSLPPRDVFRPHQHIGHTVEHNHESEATNQPSQYRQLNQHGDDGDDPREWWGRGGRAAERGGVKHRAWDGERICEKMALDSM